MKNVHAIGHEFNCLPGHVTIGGRGTGSNVRVAACMAVKNILKDKQLRGKRLKGFKMSFFVHDNGGENES